MSINDEETLLASMSLEPQVHTHGSHDATHSLSHPLFHPLTSNKTFSLMYNPI